MAGAQSAGLASIENEGAAMDGPMVRATKANDVVQRVASPLGAELEVVQIEKPRVPATRNLAASLVSHEHGTAQRGRNALLSSHARVGAVMLNRICIHRRGIVLDDTSPFGSDFMLSVALMRLKVVRGLRSLVSDRAEVLGVTVGHPGDFGADRHEPSCRLLPAGAAFGAEAQRDLVARSTFVARAAENLTSQLEQGSIVVQLGASTAAELVQRIAEECEGLGRYLEAQDVTEGCEIRRRPWSIPWVPAREHFLQLSQCLAARQLEPLVLCLADRNARELTHGRPAQLSARKGLSERGQLFERLGDAQLFLGAARFVAKQTLDVLAEAAVAQVDVCRGTLRGQEPAPFFGVRRSTLSSEPRQLPMRDPPVDPFSLYRRKLLCPHASDITCRFSSLSRPR